MDWQRTVSNWAYALLSVTLFAPDARPEALRRRFERLYAVPPVRLQQKYPGLQIAAHDIDGLHAESVTAVESPRRLIVHFHGGGFVFGSSASYRRRAARLSRRCQAEVLLVNFRLAPEHPFPAALEDAWSALRYAARRWPALPLVVSGDGAGGGLALSAITLCRAVRRGDPGSPPFKPTGSAPQPRAALLLSPWLDLGLGGRTIRENARRDVWISRRHLERWSSLYRGDAPPTGPFVSPLFADPAGLPPLMLVVGDRELLLDDSIRLAERAGKAGVAVSLEVGRRMQHNFPFALPWLAQSRRAWRTVLEFLDRHAA